MCKLLLISFLLLQNDWHQWGGAERNFAATGLAIGSVDRETPLTLTWKQPVGEGYSGVVLAKGNVISQARDGDKEYVFARDAKSGEELWRYQYLAPALNQMIPKYGFGPHSTPCISENRVYAVGGTGIISVVNLDSGKLVWTKNIWDEYSANKLERGYTSSPIVYDNKLILPVGGKGSGIVAFDIESGKEVWKATDCSASYTSPVIAKIGGLECLVCLMDQKLIAVDPGNGKLLWSYDYATFKTVHVTSPLLLPENKVFFLSSNRATLVQISKSKIEEFSVEAIWESRHITPQVGNVIAVDDQLVGPHTNMNALMTGVSQQTGNRLWRSRISNAGFYYRADDGFISINDRGVINFNQLGDNRPTSIAKAEPGLKGRVWNTAAISKNNLYMRDQDSIWAFRINRK